MKLLAISTSTPHGSVALLDADALPTAARELASASYDDLAGHAERLFSLIDQVLQEGGVERSAIGAIACDIGPGSFTGVRVAVASAKGAAVALGLPVIGVTSLEALAARAFAEGRAHPGDLVAAAVDAKKGEVFLAVFDASQASLELVLPPCHVPRAAVAEVLAKAAEGRTLVLVGEPAAPLSEGPPPELPEAAWIGRVAAARLFSGGGVDPAALEPLYVRPPDAKPFVAVAAATG
ncbi:MAG TPA: tRNA (adenosine(37)-N6)-threonylcarbamoyltransferase complex dimerization subunit type 1 TsaB [Polyangiaceae bacterium]|nr:tRNA (adenosine(37)-N6)-threonylcarbamoyltransferase complex dimerization subunit type 1 TsaB [Polyangiaceae bacterium]